MIQLFDKSVSVVIPTFNRPDLVKRAVESALNQTQPPTQIIVIDDGSDKKVVQDLREWMISKNVTFLESAHTGNPGELRSIGIHEARSCWIAFLDDDDYWHPQKLEIQLKIAQKTKVGFLSTVSISKEIPTELFEFGKPRIRQISWRKIRKENKITNSSVLVKKSLLDLVGVFAKSSQVIGAEDYATWLRLFSFSKHIQILENLTYYEDMNSISHLSKQSNNRYMQFIGLLDFVDWAQSNSKKNYFALRVLLRLARAFV